ncbi:MAG TPA: GlsB/YeaQ/YmgE family stress response membrane protein [Dokdonella sp.]|uniref:GlsB/YeaQ/YmgE family stress response membrane protein n=1 Tax=Dokdonella sp. TaxID=2291710 RepID=UPI002D7EE8BE|nr:GlsB/YeaQ/YmgE family stress response membrane protein [Dokdonella sp.]HET9033480.1 GlsB/YeaQ/YmgE family stress response membrane protein [Dokdonella sp.]
MEIFGGTNGIFMTIIIGLLVGFIAKILKPGKDPGGFIITILIGIAGSFIATFLGRTMGWYAGDQTAGIIGSVVGAIILLILYSLATRKKR